MTKQNIEALDNHNLTELESVIKRPLIDRIQYDDTHYWVESESGDSWQKFNQRSVQTYLKGLGLRFYLNKNELTEGVALSPGEELLNNIHLKDRIVWSGTLGGRRAGVYRQAGQLVLVTESPHLIPPLEPDKADDSIPRLDYGLMPYSRASDEIVGECIGWPMLGLFWRNLFTCLRAANDEADQREEDYDQLIYWYAWVQRSVQCIYQDTRLLGQAVLLSGEPGCGKSLTIWILQQLLGGKISRPLAWIEGRTRFNDSMFKSPLLVVDDEGSQTGIRNRKGLGAQVKQVVAVGYGRMEGKGRDELELEPYWRLVFATNEEEQNLLVFPPLDDDIRGKVLIFKGYFGEWPWHEAIKPAALQSQLKKELPYFLHWILNEFELPEEYRAIHDTRFGVKEWLHPEIREKIELLSPEVRLWSFIERTVLRASNFYDNDPLPAGEWKGTANDLEAALRHIDNQLTREERAKVPMAVPTLGKYLASLRKMQRYRDHIRFKRTSTERVWTLLSSDAVASRNQYGEQAELSEAGDY